MRARPHPERVARPSLESVLNGRLLRGVVFLENATSRWSTCSVRPGGRCCIRGAPCGARDVPPEAALRPEPGSRQRAEARIRKAFASGEPEALAASRRLLGANTAQVSHGDADVAVALRPVGQPASRGPSRGTGPPEVRRLPVPGRPEPTRFRLDPPEPGKNQPGFVGLAERAFRAAETALGRATPGG